MKLQKPKYLCAFLAFFLLLSMTALADAAQSWYCMREKNHARPKVEPQMAFIGDYGGVYIGPDPDEKVIYLTFDAGYENGNVERILDVLKKHEAPGAFFVLDNLIKRNTDLVLRMAEEGHLVCNHTAHHKDMTKLSDAEFEAELAALESVYKETTGYDMAKFYRPPEGKFNQENLALATSVSAIRPYSGASPTRTGTTTSSLPRRTRKKLLMDNIHNGAIVLLHPTSKTNADNLLRRPSHRMGGRGIPLRLPDGACRSKGITPFSTAASVFFLSRSEKPRSSLPFSACPAEYAGHAEKSDAARVGTAGTGPFEFSYLARRRIRPQHPTFQKGIP